jgi:hypothetical protein
MLDELLMITCVAMGCALRMTLRGGEWDKRKIAFYGKDKRPEQPVVDRGRDKDQLQVRIFAWRSPAWKQFLEKLNTVTAGILKKASEDKEIMPARRYCEFRVALNAYLKRYPASRMVIVYKSMRLQMDVIWKQCLSVARKHAEEMYSIWKVDERDAQCPRCKVLLLMDMVDVDVGGVHLRGAFPGDGLIGLPGNFSWPTCGVSFGGAVCNGVVGRHR